MSQGSLRGTGRGCGQVQRQIRVVTQNCEVVHDGDIEAISVGEDAAPGPRVQGAGSGQEEEVFS
jgi:hypothetical protein